MKAMFKTVAGAAMVGTMMFSAVGNTLAAVNVSYSNTTVYKNINGDFSSSDTYYYSTEDKKAEDHKIVFVKDSNTVSVDDEDVTIDQAPYINDGRMMLPLRAVTQTLKTFKNDVSISWNSVDRKAVIKYDGNEVVFTADSDVYTVNGKSVKMAGGKTEIKNGRSFIPLRALADAMDLDTQWQASDGSVTIKAN
jgi:hypothetical protein